MCYPKPGPRCTPHAKKSLDKAIAVLTERQDFSSFEAMKKAQADYDRTPGGQRELQEKIDREPDHNLRQAMQERLEYGIRSRKLALEEINSPDHGDINTSGDAEEHGDGTDLLTTNERLIQSIAAPGAERYFPDARSVDPDGCGCTECLTGFYVPEERFLLSASSADLRDFASGKIGNNSYTPAKDIFRSIEESGRADIEEDIAHALKAWERVDQSLVTH